MCGTARGREAVPRVHVAGREGRVLRARREVHDLAKGVRADAILE